MDNYTPNLRCQTTTGDECMALGDGEPKGHRRNPLVISLTVACGCRGNPTGESEADKKPRRSVAPTDSPAKEKRGGVGVNPLATREGECTVVRVGPQRGTTGGLQQRTLKKH